MQKANKKMFGERLDGKSVARGAQGARAPNRNVVSSF